MSPEIAKNVIMLRETTNQLKDRELQNMKEAAKVKMTYMKKINLNRIRPQDNPQSMNSLLSFSLILKKKRKMIKLNKMRNKIHFKIMIQW